MVINRVFVDVFQIEFGGLTGVIKFDKFGLRRDYKLDILEATSIGGLVKVRITRNLIPFVVMLPSSQIVDGEQLS